MHPTFMELANSLIGLKKLATAASKTNPVPKGAERAPRCDFRMAAASKRLLDIIDVAFAAKTDDKGGSKTKSTPALKAPRAVSSPRGIKPAVEKVAPATGKARTKVGSIPVVTGMSPAEKRKATLAAKAAEAKKAEAAAKRKATREAKAAAAAAEAAKKAAAAAARKTARAEKKAPAPAAEPAPASTSVDAKAEKRAAFAARMKAAREAKKAVPASTDDDI